MNGSFPGGSRGPRDRGPGPAWPGGAGLWDALDQLRQGFEQRVGGTRMGRGDVRAAVLALLAERPMHGYQLIQEIDERSGGAWKPSPGSVYPTLQLLADEGLILADESGGRKTYSLTDEGRKEAEAADRPAPWETQGVRDAARTPGLTKAGVDLAQAVAQVARTGTPDQAQQAIELLDETRRKVYSILAQG